MLLVGTTGTVGPCLPPHTPMGTSSTAPPSPTHGPEPGRVRGCGEPGVAPGHHVLAGQGVAILPSRGVPGRRAVTRVLPPAPDEPLCSPAAGNTAKDDAGEEGEHPGESWAGGGGKDGDRDRDRTPVPGADPRCCSRRSPAGSASCPALARLCHAVLSAPGQTQSCLLSPELPAPVRMEPAKVLPSKRMAPAPPIPAKTKPATVLASK